MMNSIEIHNNEKKKRVVSLLKTRKEEKSQFQHPIKFSFSNYSVYRSITSSNNNNNNQEPAFY